LDSSALPGGWTLVRLQTPLAAAARPGHAVRARTADGEVHGAVTRASPGELWLALLLPPNVDLPALRPHQPLLECALAGEPFDDLSEPPTAPVLIGEEAGIGAILFLAERIAPPPKLVLLGARVPPPLRPRPSRILVPGLPPHAIGAVPVLEERGIPSRLAHPDGTPGCYDGPVSELFGHWLSQQPPGPVRVLAAGPFGIDRRIRVAAAGRAIDLQVRLVGSGG